METSLEKRRKYFVGVLMVLILAFSLILVQQQFNQGDERKAVALVGQTKARQGGSVGEVLIARSGGRSPDCTPTIVSSCAGTLEVTCRTSEPGTYRFAVDLVRNSVKPLDAGARALMEPDAASPSSRTARDAG